MTIAIGLACDDHLIVPVFAGIFGDFGAKLPDQPSFCSN
jgi:hypothetical protein